MKKLYALFSILGVLIGGLISFLIMKDTPDVIIKNIKDGFKVKKNTNGTEKLPDTPELDKTLQGIEDDILHGKKKDSE